MVSDWRDMVLVAEAEDTDEAEDAGDTNFDAGSVD
jgi:hypothetical protein